MKERFRFGEIVALLLLACTGVAYLVETFGYRVSRFERTGGPGVYPRIILYCLFFFIVLRMAQILWERKNRAFVFFDLFHGSKGVFFFTFVLYIFLMPYLGYILSTTLYLVFASCFLTYLKEGSLGAKPRLILRSLFFFGTTMGIYWFFVLFLDVAVPAGLIEAIL